VRCLARNSRPAETAATTSAVSAHTLHPRAKDDAYNSKLKPSAAAGTSNMCAAWRATADLQSDAAATAVPLSIHTLQQSPQIAAPHTFALPDAQQTCKGMGQQQHTAAIHQLHMHDLHASCMLHATCPAAAAQTCASGFHYALTSCPPPALAAGPAVAAASPGMCPRSCPQRHP
jgi:hypothetical protein